MIWTKEKPTKPGWYWKRDHYQGQSGLCHNDGIVSVDVHESLPGTGLWVFYDQGSDPVADCSESTEWAGPIPLPVDAINDPETISMTASFQGKVFGKAIKSSQLWSDVEGDQLGYSIVDGLRELVDKAR